MSAFGFGIVTYALGRWLEKRPFAARRVEAIFWAACVLFVALILTAWLLQAVGTPAPSPGPH